MSQLQEPKHLKKLRIIGFSLIATGLLLIILGCFVFREDLGKGETIANFALWVSGVFVTFFSAPCLFIGFSAKIAKNQIERTKYVQQLNQQNLQDIANTSADISSEPVAKIVKTVVDATQKDIYCKYCGTSIDFDSRFCKNCGKEQ